MARNNLRPWRGTGIQSLDDLYKEMDGLVHHFFGEDGASTERDFLPRLNISETESDYEVTLDLPGMSPEDVSVELHDNQLTVSGKRASDKEEEGKTFHRIERQYGEFRRIVTLPAPVDESAINAHYDHGVLKVTLPKSDKLKPTRIPVKAANGAAG